MKPLFFSFLFIFGLSEISAQDLSFTLMPNSGVYSADTALTPKGPDNLAYSFYFLDHGSSSFLPLRGNLLLTALPGEARTYGIRVQGKNPQGEGLIKDFFYTIDKRIASPPSINPGPGTFTQDQTIVLSGQGEIYWALDQGEFERYNGQTINLRTSSGTWKNYKIRSYLQTSDGKKSVVKTWNYRIDKSLPAQSGVKILSPVPGRYANSQLLFVQTLGNPLVRYTLDGSDPALTGEAYTAPIILEKPGVVKLRLWAKFPGGAEPVVSSVDYEVLSGIPSLPGIPNSGVYTSDISVDLQGAGAYKVSTQELVPTEYWKKSISFSMVPGLQKFSVFRVLTSAGEFRYSYIQDDRNPTAPGFTVTGGFRPFINLEGHPEALLKVTKDGSEPNIQSSGYDGPWLWETLEKQGVKELKALAVFPNGRVSSVKSFTSAQIKSPTQAPEFRWIRSPNSPAPLGMSFSPPEGLGLIYEVSESRGKCPLPHELSPEGGNNFLPDVPWGQERTFYFRFAYRDSSGQVGAPTGEIAFSVDRIPPMIPNWSVSDNKLILTGEGTFLYVISDKPVSGLDKQKAETYTGPVTLPQAQDGEKKTFYLHVIATDGAGNSSEPLVNQSILRDSRSPGILGFRGLAHKALVSTSELEIIPEVSGTGFEIWYSITEDGKTPGPVTSGKLYTGPIKIQGLQGTTKVIQTLWNLKKGEKWLLAESIPLTVTQDLEPPKVPHFLNFPEGQVLTGDTVLEISPTEASDSLYYTLTRDRPNGLSPLGPQAKIWEGTLALNLKDDDRGVFYLRLAVKDGAGNAFEILGLRPISIDKRIPVTPRLVDIPTVHRAVSEIAIKFEPQPDPIYYLLTDDGSQPGLPSAYSSVYQKPLNLNGKEGDVTVYKLRSVSVNAQGISGAFSDMYTIVVDRRPESASESVVSTQDKPILGIQGLPAGGYSASPVKLSAVLTRGVLRYESASGALELSAVGPYSPILESTWEAQGKDGEEIPYKMAFQLFDPVTNLPISEVQTADFIIDRRLPDLPTIRLTPDSTQPRVVLDLAPQRDQQYYRVKFKTLEGEGTPGPWTLYTAAVDLKAPGGRFAKLEVDSYAEDKAGNKGPVSTQGIVLTQGVVYITPGGKGVGTAADPMGSFELGIKKARAENRKVIFLGQGQLTLNEEADLTDLEVFGGLDSETWDPFAFAGRTTLVPRDGWTDAAFLSAYKGAMRLSGIDINDNGNPVQSLLILEDVKAFLKDLSFKGKGSTLKRGIVQTRGSLALTHVDIQVSGGPEELALMDLSQIKLWGEGVGLLANGSQGQVFVYMDRVEGVLKNLTLDGQGAKTLETGLSLTQSDLKLESCNFRLGKGAPLASALILKDSYLEALALDVTLDSHGGTTGIKLDNSSLIAQDSKISLGASSQFSHVLSATASVVKLNNSRFEIKDSAYLAAIVLSGSRFEMLASSLLMDLGKASRQCFLLMGENTLNLASNHFTAQGVGLGWCFLWPQTPKGKKTFSNNILEGWTSEAHWEKNNGLLSDVP